MNRDNDIVIGAITDYDFDKIKYWCNSLDSCGFTGTKALLCFNVSYDVIQQLQDRGYLIFAFNDNKALRRFEYPTNTQWNIVVERFLYYPTFLSNKSYNFRYLIATDVKDVIFQRNPSEFLEETLGGRAKIVASCESIRYKDEDWGANNFKIVFGDNLFEKYQYNLIWNAGVMAGEFKTMLDLFLNIYFVSKSRPQFVPGGGGPDQAVYNFLLGMNPYINITKERLSEDGWAAQLGTTGQHIKPQYEDRLIEPSPILVGDTVCTSLGDPFYIVHQYDRIPEWKNIIETKYA